MKIIARDEASGAAMDYYEAELRDIIAMPTTEGTRVALRVRYDEGLIGSFELSPAETRILADLVRKAGL